MSGGRFGYRQSDLSYELYGYGLDLSYGEKGFKQSEKAAQINPFNDVELSELFWDMLCLVQSLDYYKSGDNGKHVYQEDKQYFKNKWFNITDKERIKRIATHCLNEAKDNISESLGIEL